MGVFIRRAAAAMVAPSFSFSFSFSGILLLAFAFLIVNAYAFSFDDLEDVQFSYDGHHGPDNWGKLSSKYQKCQVGKTQSPIHIRTDDHVVLNSTLKPLTRTYSPGKATLVNYGYGIGVRFEEEVGSLSVDGKKYSLKQLLFHTPAEHVIDGNNYTAELQLIHATDEDDLAVVSILYQYGGSDSFLSKMKNGLEEMAKDKCGNDEVSEISLGTMDTKLIRRNTRRYYRYVGSLTTPPCSEPVIWFILGKIRTISKDQVAEVKALLSSDCKDNARPQQSLNGRSVQLYDEN